MLVRFYGTSAPYLIDHLNTQLRGRGLHSFVTTQHTPHELIITITKFGTSKLHFAIHEQALAPPDSSTASATVASPLDPASAAGEPAHHLTEITLVRKKITFTHRPIERELVAKLQKMILQLGGEVVRPYAL